MSKGGILPKKETGSLSHLYRGKWNLGKTVTLRIPLVLKFELLKVAQYFDKNGVYENRSQTIIDYIEERKSVENELKEIKLENEKLKKELNRKNKIIDLYIDAQEKSKIDDKYQNALECFTEYLDTNNLKISESKPPRKGTIKRELFDIKFWFKNKCSTLTTKSLN